jgi:hypothetical protein
MSGFKCQLEKGVALHTGDPDSDSAHSALLAGLQHMETPFIGPTETINIGQQGNLGEYIALHIARTGKFKAH